MKKIKNRILTIFIGILLNVAGRVLAHYFGVPGYLNVAGTILVSYREGMLFAILTAVFSGAANSFFFRNDYFFIISDVAIAVISRLLAKRNRYLEKTLLTMSTTALLSIIKAILVLIGNIILYGGDTGFEMSDGIIHMLDAAGVAPALNYIIAALYVSFLDVLVGMTIVYIGFNIRRHVARRKKARRLKKALGGKITLGAVLIALIIPSFSFSDSYAESSINFIESVYDAENGLIGGCLNDIDMTEDGSMWIGTYGGLYRFNGSKFILIDNVKNVRSVQTLYVDRYDRLFVGTQDAGVTLMNIDQTWFTLDMSRGLPANSVKDVVSDCNDLYYIGTTAGVVTARVKNGEIVIEKMIGDIGNIKHLAADGRGNVAAVNGVGEVYLLRDGEVTDFIGTDVVTHTCVSFDPRGELYIGTDDELIKKYNIVQKKFQGDGSIAVKNFKAVNDVFFDDDGLIYIATDSGIGYIEDNRVNVIETGKFNNSVDKIFKDYQGNIWFSSSRCGLLGLAKSCFGDVFKLCGIKDSPCNAIIDWNGYLCVGSNDGFRMVDVENSTSVANRLSTELDGIRVRDMAYGEYGTLLVATYGKGLVEADKSGGCTSYLEEGEIDKKVRLVYRLSDKTVVASTDSGLFFMKDHKLEDKLSLGDELSGATILNILETDDGKVLAGSDGDGIAVIENKRLKRYITKDDGLSSGVILRIVKDIYDDGYFVLTGSGMNYLDKDFNVRDLYVPYFNNFDIKFGEGKQVFIMGGAGVFVVNYDVLISGRENDAFTLLDIRAGLPGSLTSNAWNYIDENGMMYICGNNGIYSLNVNDYTMNVSEYKTKITLLKVGTQVIDVTEFGRIDIPRGADYIEFSLEMNNFTTTDPVIRYYMAGVDREKITINASELESVSYYMLPYGDHEFHIEVLNESGRVITEQIYVFHKEMEVYETFGFLVYFYSLMIIFAAFIVISIVQGALLAQTKKSDNRHEKVISILEKEKAEALERALLVEEDANRTKSDLLAKVSCEVRNPINSIIGLNTMILRESDQEEIKDYAKDIHDAGQSLLVMINDILDFSKVEMTSGEFTSAEYETEVLITDIINMVKPAADKKKVRLEVDVDPDIPERLNGDDGVFRQNVKTMLSNMIRDAEEGSIHISVSYKSYGENRILLKFIAQNSSSGERSVYEAVSETVGFSKIGDYDRRRDIVRSRITEPERFHAPKANVLLVDASEDDAKVFENLLRRTKVNFERAAGTQQALNLCNEIEFDVIFVESVMPGTYSEETMRLIQSDCPLNLKKPVIALSGHSAKGTREEYLNLGYTNFLAKPIDGIKLEAILQSYIPEDKLKPVIDESLSDSKALEEEKVKREKHLKALKKIPEINVEAGIEFSDGEEAYDMICRSYCDTASGLVDKVRDAYEKKDVERYTLLMHKFKNSSRIIGAESLTLKIGELESAGLEHDMDFIESKTEEVIEEYVRLHKDLLGVFYGEKA